MENHLTQYLEPALEVLLNEETTDLERVDESAWQLFKPEQPEVDADLSERWLQRLQVINRLYELDRWVAEADEPIDLVFGVHSFSYALDRILRA
mgnify:CR=1 FL=1